jgi:hypothetical protein
VVANFLKTFKTWLPLDNFDNAEWIRSQLVKPFLQKCACEIWEARKKPMRGNKGPETDLGERASNMARSNLPERPNTTFMVVICQVLNGQDIVLSTNQLQAAYPNVRHQEELIDFININGRMKEPYTVTLTFRCTLEKDQLDEEYMGL